MKLLPTREMCLFSSISLASVLLGTIAINCLTDLFSDRVSQFSSSIKLPTRSQTFCIICLGITVGASTSIILAHKVANLPIDSFLAQSIHGITLAVLALPLITRVYFYKERFKK